MIDPAKLGVGREDYYLREVAEDREAYLSGHGEAPGYWLGTAAGEAFGLSGEVTAEQFRRVFVGKDPRTGALLGRHHRTDGVLAYDFVFRPTKSVALLYGLGNPEESQAAMAAHHAGLEAAVAYLERFAKLRRGRNGVDKVDAAGLLAVGFDHRASRAGDPLPHTHVIIMNRAQGPDERWTAPDGRPILDELKAADAVYRATYQRQLTATLGLEWSPADEHGNRELAGIPEEMIRHFSKARCRIEEELTRRQAEGLPVTPAVTNWLAHQLREAKTHEAAPTQRGRWAAEATGRGWDVRTLFDRMRGQVRTQQQLGPDERQVIFDQLACPTGLTGQASTFTRGHVLRAIGNQVATLPVAELETLADQFLSERAVQLLTDPRTGAWRYSTPELLELERGIVEQAAARHDEDRHVVPHQVVQAVVDRYETLGKPLGADQAEVVHSACTGGAGICLVVGRAGTGKTFTMDAVRTAFQTANLLLPEGERMTVRGLAPTGIAALELDAGAGIRTLTVDRFLCELDQGRDRLNPTDVVVIDEANMLGTRKFARLFDHVNAVGAKLIAVGDDKQLQSIDTGGWYRGLRLRLGAAELTENRRQLDRLDQQAVELIRAGRAEEAMAIYRDGGRVNVAKTAAEAYDAMTADWWEAFSAGQDAVMLAHRRVEVDRLNDLAHQAMAAAGRLGPDSLENAGRQFRVGDRVVCGANRLALGIANGTKGWVAGIDQGAHTLTIETDSDSDSEVILPASYLRAQLSDHRRPLDYAYAITGHKSEGITVDRAFIRGGAHADQQWAYVMATRVRQRADFYLIQGPTPPEHADELDLAPPRSQDPYDVAVAALGRSDPQRMAIDTQREADRPHPGALSTKQLRAERDELAQVLAARPRPQALSFRQTSQRLADTQQRLDAAEARKAELDGWVASHGRGLAALAHRDAVKAARDELAQLDHLARHLRGRVDELAARQRGLRRAEQQRAVWDEAHAGELNRHRQVATELAWRNRARSQARTVDTPSWLADLLGDVPQSVRGRRAWRRAAEQVESYRDRYHIESDGLGPQPTELGQRRAWRDCQQATAHVQERTQARHTERGHQLEIG